MIMSTSISSILIHSAPSQVWAALTEPELVKQWQYGSILFTDWQVGSEIRFRNEWEGQTFEQWGSVLEYAPYTSLKYSLFAPRPGLEVQPENYFIMSYILTDESGSTLLRIEQQDNRPGSSAEVTESSDEEGQSVLQLLKNLVETS